MADIAVITGASSGLGIESDIIKQQRARSKKELESVCETVETIGKKRIHTEQRQTSCFTASFSYHRKREWNFAFILRNSGRRR